MGKKLEKDYAERLSQETKKVTNSINNKNNKNISDIDDDFSGEIQNAFISVAYILRSDATSQITPFSRECFIRRPLWRAIKNSGRAGSGREDSL